ncbi:hypothetical protein M885DRAFT_513458 [Pelagophyceae sp. CCMP2097]|nr:hypothetical protein M885DRAFT_513458 [Pelagophyceae sp. CCMP2097]
MKAMFQPGPPLPFKDKITKKKCGTYTGISSWTSLFETGEPPARILQETPQQRKAIKMKEKAKLHAVELEAAIKGWDPAIPRDEVKDLTTGDAFKTLFVARLSYDTTEKKLRREFEQYGDIKKVRVVHVEAPPVKVKTDDDMDDGVVDEAPVGVVPKDVGKPRGYAFIEFEKEADMRAAYKRADGRRIEDRRILVDVERGRTVRNWKPRRLGGGLGNSRGAASLAGKRVQTERQQRIDPRRGVSLSIPGV